MRYFLHMFSLVLVLALFSPMQLMAQQEDDCKTQVAYNYKDIDKKMDYVGIGVVVEKKRDFPWLPIKKVKDNGPAAEAGLQKGDHIVKIDGEPVTKKSIDEIAEIMLGPVNSTVTIEYMRNHKFRSLTVKRKPITF